MQTMKTPESFCIVYEEDLRHRFILTICRIDEVSDSKLFSCVNDKQHEIIIQIPAKGNNIE